MGSKTLVSFCISLAMVLMIFSEVAARELAESSTSMDNTKEVKMNSEEAAMTSTSGCGGFPRKGYGRILIGQSSPREVNGQNPRATGYGPIVGDPGGGYPSGGYPRGGYPGRGYPGGGYPGGGGYGGRGGYP